MSHLDKESSVDVGNEARGLGEGGMPGKSTLSVRAP